MRGISKALILTGVVALSAAAEAPSQELDASALFSAASAAFDAGRYGEAAAGFEAARAAGMQGPAVLYNAGVSAYREGQHQAAERAFREIIEDFPAMRPIAEYNLGLTLLAQGRRGEARAAFERARLGGEPTIAKLAEAILGREDESAVAAGVPAAPPAPRWAGVVDLAFGHDDNVALLDEASLPAGVSTGSPSLEVFALVRGRPGSSDSVRLDANAYVVRYSRAPSFNQQGLRVAIDYLWDAGDWLIDAGPHYSHSVLDGTGFERRLGASLIARYLLADNAFMSVGFSHDDIDDLSAAFRYVAGTRDRLSFGFEQRGDRGRFELGYVHERNDRTSPGVSPTRHEVFAGYEHLVSDDWSFEVQGLLRSSRYSGLAQPRDESLSQLSLMAARDFDSGWRVLGQYRIGENASDADAFAYERNRFTVRLNRLF